MKLVQVKKQSGQGLVEYILIVALIAILAIAAIKLFGKKVSGSFKDTAEKVEHEVSNASEEGQRAVR
jgi:Flp pilus assembly pilin Flp